MRGQRHGDTLQRCQVRGNFVVSSGRKFPGRRSSGLAIQGQVPPTLISSTVAFQARLGAGPGLGLGLGLKEAKGSGEQCPAVEEVGGQAEHGVQWWSSPHGSRGGLRAPCMLCTLCAGGGPGAAPVPAHRLHFPAQ